MSKFNTVTRKILSLSMAFVLALGAFGFAPVLAAEASGCNHIHDADCSYAEGAACGHVHDESCGGLALGDSGTPATPANAPQAGYAVTFDIPVNEYGETALYLPEGVAVTDADLLSGVTAADENGGDVAVTVKDVGGLDRGTPAPGGTPTSPTPYVITYKAVHPDTGEAFTAAREAYVTIGIVAAASTPSSNIFDVIEGKITIEQGTGGAGFLKVTYGSTENKDNIADTEEITIIGTTSSAGVVVQGGVTANITLSDVSINVSEKIAGAFIITGNSTINLTLSGTNELKSGQEYAGLEVGKGNTLVITAASTGSVTATGGISASGIGGSRNHGGGTVTINGGTVYANGGMSCAGIGGGRAVSSSANGAGGTVTINGGTVYATGDGNGAGIGGGGANENGGPGGTVIITGGTVHATIRGQTGAGIGSAGPYYPSKGTLQITGGNVEIGGNGGRNAIPKDGANGSGNTLYLVTATVTDARSNPQSDATITVGAYTAPTGTDGKALLWLPIGERDFIASKSGYSSGNMTYSVSSTPPPNDVTIAMPDPDTTEPTVLSVSPSRTDVDVSGNIVITFSEAMDTSAGTVSLDGGIGALSGSWSTTTYTNDTFTAAYSGLIWSTSYTITIEDFADIAGNEIDPHPDMSNTFTTKAQPTGPDVSPTTLNLDLNGNPTGTLTVSLGQSGNQAAQANISVAPANAGDISVSRASLNADGTVTVTGNNVVNGAALTVEFSGGDLASPTSIPVSVTVTDSTPVIHTVNFDLAGGTHTGGGALTQTVPDGGAATAPTTTRSGYTLTSWDRPFNNVTADITVTAQWRYNGGNNNNNGGGSSYTPPMVWPIEVTIKPNFLTTARLTLSQAPDKNNALSYTITKEMVQQALDKAKEKAKADGREDYGYALEFYFDTAKTINSMNISFADDALALLESAGIKETSVITGAFRFGFDLATIKQLNSQIGGRAVTLSASRFSKLSDAAKKLIGSRPTWDITIGFKKDGKTYNITSLGKGFITMGMKYTPASDEKTGNLAVVYVAGSGKPQILTNSSYDGGWMIWQHGMLSVYGVGYITPAPAFTDTVNHWAKDNIDFVANRGLISGTSATVFSPDTAITRADFLMALGKLSGADMSGYTTSSFTDVANTAPAMPFIEWAVKNNIVQGVGNNKFGPDNKITREDMAVMMVNYAKATGYTLPVSRQAATFADDAKISAYAKDAVKAIQQTGVISGKPNNLFDPQGNATRAEASTILRRFVELVIDEGTARGWVQNDAGQWQYINTNGKAVTSNWLTSGENKYYFDDKGVMVSVQKI